jgi:ABC-2 type transport system ATP-binding protein
MLSDLERPALTRDADRITMPAPKGVNTLVQALWRLDAANIELADIALRRPSLDEVFLSLTMDPEASATTDVLRADAGR